MEPYSGDTKVIAKVGTTPEDRGLVTEDFKAKFDEGLTAFVEWFNTTHKTEFEAHLAEDVSDDVHGLLSATNFRSAVITTIVPDTVEELSFAYPPGFNFNNCYIPATYVFVGNIWWKMSESEIAFGLQSSIISVSFKDVSSTKGEQVNIFIVRY